MLLRKTCFPLIMLIALGCSGMTSDRMVLSGTIEADSVHPASRVGGRVKLVNVDEGREVKKDDVLFTLEDNVLTAQKAQLEASMDQAQAAYDVVASGAKPEDIARAQQQAEAARQSYELAQAGPLASDVRGRGESGREYRGDISKRAGCGGSDGEVI